jgi:hypothetical protein
VSFDADDLWSYLRTRGDATWRDRPSYLPALVPAVLDALDAAGLRITFFVVGRDAARPENAALLRSLTARGHEVGNHSHEHEPWLQRYTTEELTREIAEADDAIAQATGTQPVGFRGPGYSWSPTLLELLADRGYVYDSSTWPTFIGPLARWYYVRGTHYTPSEAAERETLFGAFSDGLRPLRPYRWTLSGGRSLLEIPVTTLPILRLPIHQSYLLYLARVSERAMVGYLRAALVACRWGRIEPAFLLHPTDVLGAEDAPRLSFFPGMDLPRRRKLALLGTALGVLREYYAPDTMISHARALLARELPRTRTATLAALAG